MTQWGLDTLFNPAKRHMDEEKRRLQSTREEVGDNSGGKRIDLESGKVTIRRDDAVEDEGADGAVNDGSDATASKSGASKERTATPRARSDRPNGEPSAAAIRAAKRRGREPR